MEEKCHTLGFSKKVFDFDERRHHKYLYKVYNIKIGKGCLEWRSDERGTKGRGAGQLRERRGQGERLEWREDDSIKY